MGIVTQIAGLLLSLSILVVLHEFGHFLFAKIFKTRVEKFYLFFNPWFELFKFKKGETEYGIGWLPLGGYVKISGMIDESMDKEQMSQPAQPWEFRSKPTWQRLLIMTGGVLVNFVLALIIYSFVLYTWGKEYISAENVPYGLVYHEELKQIGFQDGDNILYVDTIKVDNIQSITAMLLLDNPKDITVSRNGNLIKIPFPEGFEKQIIEKEIRELYTLRIPYIVDTVIPGSPGEKAGFLKNDSIVAVNGVSTPYFAEFTEEKLKLVDSSGTITVSRNNQLVDLNVQLGSDGMIGLGNKDLDYFLKLSTVKYSFLEAIPAGISMGVEKLVFYVKQMKWIFSKEGAKQLGGFGAIGSLFPTSWDWMVFWNMTAFISLVLAFMNILPIPALDGGHVLFLLYEMITGRKPSDKFMEYAQITGMVLIFALILYANANDVIRAFF